MESMTDIGLIRGVITALLFGAFVGVVLWAYSGRRKHDFEQAAHLPLEDDSRPVPEATDQSVTMETDR